MLGFPMVVHGGEGSAEVAKVGAMDFFGEMDGLRIV